MVEKNGDKMDNKAAGLSFAGVCVILAVLLLTKTINPIISGAVFSIALATFGLLSQGAEKTAK